AAFAAGTDEVHPVKPTGIAKSLNIGDPADGSYALEVVRRTGGARAAATGEEIRRGIALLARPPGSLAATPRRGAGPAARQVLAAGALDPDAETVVFNTGEGLKTIDAMAGRAVPTYAIAPSLRSARAAGLR